MTATATAGPPPASTTTPDPGTTTAQPSWTSAPAGGNGGATDVGVTATTLTVATVTDKGGAAPGVTADAALAVRAYVAYFTEQFGTVYGRRLALLELDSAMDAGGTRSATQRACTEAFAGVGSWSLFEQAAAPVLADCRSAGGRFPDLRAVAAAPQLRALPNVYPLEVADGGALVSLRRFGWATDAFPDAVRRAAHVHPDDQQSTSAARHEMTAAEEVFGYTWVADVAVPRTELNYTPVAMRLKSAGAQYVSFTGTADQAAALAKALRSVGWQPQVLSPGADAYSERFLSRAGEALSGGNTFVPVTSAVTEERSDNDELQRYAHWLDRVEPGARPTPAGQRAWGAASLFVQQAITVGPRPTRRAFLALMPGVSAFSAHGLYAPEDVGGRRPGDCVTVLRIVDRRFARFTPREGGYRCGADGLWDVAAGRRVPAARP